MTRFSNFLYRISPGWAALLATVIFFAFTATVLPAQSRTAEGAAGGGDTPDLSIYYSAADLYRMAESYGAAGRQAYVYARYTFDVAWPLVYWLFLTTVISWSFRRGFPASTPARTARPWRLANLAPTLAVLFDLLENLSTSLVMLRFPAEPGLIGALAGPFTTLKWFFVGVSFVLLVVGLAAAIVAAVRHSRD